MFLMVLHDPPLGFRVLAGKELVPAEVGVVRVVFWHEIPAFR